VSTTKAAPPPVDDRDADDPQGWRVNSPLVLIMLLLLVVALQGPIRGAVSAPVM
jgi:uncharacterized protein